MATKEQIQALARFDAAMCFRTSNQEETMTQPKATADNLTDEQIQTTWQAAMRMQSDDGDRLAGNCEDALSGIGGGNELRTARVRIAAAINASREGSK